jgi:integrase
MINIYFRIRKGAKNPASIKVILSQGRKGYLESKTGYTIDPKNWSLSKKVPKQNNAEAKNLYNKLSKLKQQILTEASDALEDNEVLDKLWLQRSLDVYFGRKTKVTVTDDNVANINEPLKGQIQHILDKASIRQIKGTNRIGLSKGRIQNYNSSLKIIEEYEKYISKTVYLKDLSSSFIENFKLWLLDHQEYSTNYAGKQISNIRAVARDAKKRGYSVHKHVDHIEAFAESNSDRRIVTLSLDELKRIQLKEMPNKHLENAKKWLLLGCDIGQRGGDLLELTEKNIRYLDEQPLVDLVQQKTKKEVTIPISSEYVKENILSDLPHKISKQKLNKYIKDVCEATEINSLEEGKLLDKDINRKVTGEYPKYKLITTHSFRRSFATNYYKKVPTPILIALTGHSKESIFLKYINRQEDKDENAKLFMKYLKG